MEKNALMNKIFHLDNLELLKSIPDAFINLIYIDPPFLTQKDFTEFNDKWKGMDEYISFLEVRVREMHRALKENGSFYLHCDYRASHYIRMMLDGIFGYENFVNEIIWCFRGGGRGNYFARKHETIFFYAKGKEYTFNDGQARIPYSESYGGGAFYYSKKKTQMPRSLKCGTNLWSPNDQGKIMEDYWTDIPVLGSQSEKRNGYPTQKPEELLERVILVSSNENDVIADFFCGSGTTLVVAKKNNRKYIGCDININAVNVTNERLDKIKIVEKL